MRHYKFIISTIYSLIEILAMQIQIINIQIILIILMMLMIVKWLAIGYWLINLHLIEIDSFWVICIYLKIIARLFY